MQGCHTCGWRILNCHLETATSVVLFRSANSPTLRRHEGPAGTLCTFIESTRVASTLAWQLGSIIAVMRPTALLALQATGDALQVILQPQPEGGRTGGDMMAVPIVTSTESRDCPADPGARRWSVRRRNGSYVPRREPTCPWPRARPTTATLKMAPWPHFFVASHLDSRTSCLHSVVAVPE